MRSSMSGKPDFYRMWMAQHLRKIDASRAARKLIAHLMKVGKKDEAIHVSPTEDDILMSRIDELWAEKDGSPKLNPMQRASANALIRLGSVPKRIYRMPTPLNP